MNANVCGVADEAGGYGECGDIRLFLHRSKNTHLLLSVSRTKAVGKDGGYGQRERNVVRVSLFGEVHRRHDGAPSSSGERRRREGHRVSLHIYVASYFIMDILMNFLIFRIFIGKRLRQRQRKWAATFWGGQQRSGGSEERQWALGGDGRGRRRRQRGGR